MIEIQLKQLKKTNFYQEYKKLFKKDEALSSEWKLYILKTAILLLNSENKELKKLGYRIIILYSIKFKEYHALYDIALNLGYFPISKFIEKIDLNIKSSETFLSEYQNAFIETLKTENYYSTYEQFGVKQSLDLTLAGISYAVIAPTSYGKSELIEESVKLESPVCIIVPTKALLAQTKRRILKKISDQKIIITHPEMKLPEDRNTLICILTQERLLRLLQINEDLYFNFLYVDEAHNLLEDSDRARLLAASIMMSKKRNNNLSIIHLTPFLNDSINLQIESANVSLKELKVTENLKSERFILCDLRKGQNIELYDQYFNTFETIGISRCRSEAEFVVKHSAKKNIIYLNRPVHAQRFARLLASSLDKITDSKLLEAISNIKESVHKDYDLLYCIERGVVYHHGSMPDNIKLYIENLFSENQKLKFLVTTSTLLEGVNIPAERLFVLDHRKGISSLTSSQFKNLVGRVCRFKEIFHQSNRDIRLLSPKIYLVGSTYMPLRANLKNFLKKSLREDQKNEDRPENILLEAVELGDDRWQEYEDYGNFVNNIEPGTLKGVDTRQAKTDFGKECFKNNVFEFNILAFENKIQKKINQYISQRKVFQDPYEIMEAIFDIFIKDTQEFDKADKRNLKRFDNIGTRNFYSLLLKWRIENTSMKEMIWLVCKYWQELIDTSDDAYIYAGTWGEEAWRGHLPRWVNISKKSKIEMTNLAIVRIKDEFDFLDNTLIKFIEIMNTFKLLPHDNYLKLKYGTTDMKKIDLIKSGMSLQLTSLILNKYNNLIVSKGSEGQICLNEEIIDQMTNEEENSLLIFEARFHIYG